MSTHIALLRAVNVAGTGKLPMADLRTLCAQAGFADVRTYIQSGNVVFASSASTLAIQAKLERALAAKLGKPCRVLLRSVDELGEVVARNPFPEVPANRLMVLFLHAPPAKAAIQGWKIPGRERLALDGRELYIHFPDGQGQSRLKVPFAEEGTGRNLNTVRKLLEMARA